MAANDDEDPPVITAVDYLRKLNQLEQEAKDTYRGRIDSCSFRLGYVTQPIYSCLSETCRESSSPAGFCYACSVSCHTDHKVIELFTKRHFRCDCGTKNSPNTPCCLITGQDDERKRTTVVVNEENVYNHNFNGRYCWCDRVYDPYSEEGTMFQCVLCYDWRHEKCIGLIPLESDFDDYVCRTCVAETKLLKRYRGNFFIAGISKPYGVVERLEGYDDKQRIPEGCGESEDIREADVKKTQISETHATRNVIVGGESEDIREVEVKKTEISKTRNSVGGESEDIRKAEVKKTETHATRNSVGVKSEDIREAEVKKTEISDATRIIDGEVLQTTISSSKATANTLSATPKRLRTLAPGSSPRNSPCHRSGSPATPTTGGRIKRFAAGDLEALTPTKRARVSTAGSGGCCLSDMPEVSTDENVDLFCKEGWLEALCRCSTCMSEYKHTIDLLTEDDNEYEPELDEDDDEDPSIFERGMKALGSMPRTTQVDGAMAYNKMRDEIKGFLSGFASSGEIVKKDDVLKFFEEKKAAHLKERYTQPGQFF